MNVIDNIGITLFLGSDSAFLDYFALTVTNALVWVPMFVAMAYMVIKNNDNIQQILVFFGCVALMMLLSAGVCNIVVKPLAERLRPCNTPELKYLVQIAGNYHAKDYSFFSSHAANTVAVTTFFGIIVRSKRLFFTLFTWYLLSIWSRLYLGQHFLTDIAAGTLWGIISAFIACFVYIRIYAKVTEKKSFISEQYTTTGFALSDVNIIVTVFLLTVMTAMVCGPLIPEL